MKEVVRNTIPRVAFLSVFDTLEYLRRGGRIGAAQALLGAMLKINPIITLRNGLVEPAGRTRSRSQAIDRLCEFVNKMVSLTTMPILAIICQEIRKYVFSTARELKNIVKQMKVGGE